jgi:Polyketide cyclase / dehydrase and lipid transport
MKTRFAAERRMDVAPDIVYHCIADYQEHHRPGGFLPPSFSDFAIIRGGVGAGSELTWVVEAGGNKRTINAVVSEPQPGRVLVETSPAIVTRFTVEPADGGSLVRFDTVIDEGGLKGVMNRLFAPRLLVPIYRDELERLEEYARTHGPLPG